MKKGKLIQMEAGAEPPQENTSIGEEYIQWMEQYYSLEKNYTIEPKEGAEHAPYSYFRELFVNKINEIIKQRL